MIKRVFGGTVSFYINPEAVGWVTHEITHGDPKHPNRVKRDVVEVFSKDGIKIHSQEYTASDHVEAKKNEGYVEAVLTALGLKEEAGGK